MIRTKHVKVRVEGRLGRITLDRPEAINALTQAMIEEIDYALDCLGADPEVTAIAFDGAGERGFCAGADVVTLRGSALEGGAAARRFLWAEYRLNARIASFPKPVVAVMDGITMGGGVGLAGHAAYRIATESLVWAMPEVLIGFTPDVGGTYLLSRLPGEFGTWIALTAQRLDAGLAAGLGLADVVLSRAEVEEVLRDLAEADPVRVLAAVDGRWRTAASVAAPGSGQTGAGAATVPDELREWADACFGGDDATAIEAALERDGSARSTTALAALRRGSPTSVTVTLAALRRARELPSLEACLEAEYRTACSFLACEDFREGIRAVLVEKDGKPAWSPPRRDQVDDETVARMLAGPDGLESLWREDDQERRAAWMSA